MKHTPVVDFLALKQQKFPETAKIALNKHKYQKFSTWMMASAMKVYITQKFIKDRADFWVFWHHLIVLHIACCMHSDK